MPCYSEREKMSKCDEICDFCKNHYAQKIYRKLERGWSPKQPDTDVEIPVKVSAGIKAKLERLSKKRGQKVSSLVYSMILRELEIIGPNDIK